MLIAFNKPFGVICQFSPVHGKPCLKDYIAVPGVYPAGRLDTDSEGLLLLTDEGKLQARIAEPRHKWVKTYWAQVEGLPTPERLQVFGRRIDLGDFVCAPAAVRLIGEPLGLWPRDPPIRVRRAIPVSWLEIKIAEGKHRQVRRMTAYAGFPTLRLIRAAVGPITLGGLRPGEWRSVAVGEWERSPQARSGSRTH
jgi:23S rRNA pseudouridine2457 synthase